MKMAGSTVRRSSSRPIRIRYALLSGHLAALQVPHVGLGEVLVLAHDDDGALPEVLGLVLVVAEQPLEDVVALADGGHRPRRVVWVGAEEQVDAGASYLLPLAELVELGARRNQHLAGPVADLGEEDAGGLAVGEEDADGLAGHPSASGPSDRELIHRRPGVSAIAEVL